MPWLLYVCKFFSDFLCSDMSLLFVTVTLRGVSNKHCLLSLFSFLLLFDFCILPMKCRSYLFSQFTLVSHKLDLWKPCTVWHSIVLRNHLPCEYPENKSLMKLNISFTINVR